MNKQNRTYKKLGEVVAITMGQSPASDTYNESEGLPFFQGNADFGKEHPSVRIYCNSPIRIADSGDILISVRAPIGAINIADRKCCIGRGLAAIRGNDNYISRFIYYLLMASKEKLVSQGTGSTFKSIGKDVLYNMLIPVPPLSTQSRIVSELDLLQSIIDKQKSQLKELDNLAQAIFYDMFGDPVENEKGWEVKKFGDECSEMKYGTSRPSCENGKYPYLRMCNISNDGHLDLNNLKTIDVPNDEVEKCIVRYGDILFNRTNSIELIGKTCMFDSETPMIIAGYIIRVRLSEKLESRFISCLFNMPSIKKKLRAMAKGAVNQANINSRELASVIIPIPPLSLQQSFAQKVESIERQKELINQSIREAQTLFDSRMEYYFGE